MAFDLLAKNNRIENSLFKYLGFEAIRFAGYGIGQKDENHHNIIRNNAYGIALRESNGCNIINNLVINCSWGGIQIRDSNNNDIHENTMAYNSYGVWITSTSSLNNKFYHNNFAVFGLPAL